MLHRAIGATYRWLRRNAQLVGAASSIVIAILAFSIQQQIANQEEHRASVQRSVALYQDFMKTDAIERLRKEQHKIEYAEWSKTNRKAGHTSVGLGQSLGFAYASNTLSEEGLSQLRGWLVILLQNVEVIYDCVEYDEDLRRLGGPTRSMEQSALEAFWHAVTPGPDEEQLPGRNAGSGPAGAGMFSGAPERDLCDAESIYILMNGVLGELFFTYRQFLYCDEFLRSSYFVNNGPGSYIGQFETLIIDHLMRDHDDEHWFVFRTHVDRQRAIDADHLSAINNNYWVVRPSRDTCDGFEPTIEAHLQLQ